jgi:hypothetical protein
VIAGETFGTFNAGSLSGRALSEGGAIVAAISACWPIEADVLLTSGGWSFIMPY